MALKWYILFVYGCIGTQFMINWFIFGSITTQTQDYYRLETPSSGSVNHVIATILSLGPFVFFIAAPFAVYMLRYPIIGFQYSMRIAALSAFIGMLFICIPSILSIKQLQHIFKYNYNIDGSFWNTIIFLYIGAIINCIASPLFLSSPAKLSVMWFTKSERNTITGFGATIGNLGQCLTYFIPPLLVKQSSDVPKLLYFVLLSSFIVCCMVFIYFPPHPKKFPSLAGKISTMSLSSLLPNLPSPEAQQTQYSSKQILNIDKPKLMIINDDIDNDNESSISTDSDADEDIKFKNNQLPKQESTSNYEPLPFGHTETNLIKVQSETTNFGDNINDKEYTPLPFAHTGTNLFASDLQLNKTNFKEYLKCLLGDFKQLFCNIKRNKSSLLLLIAGGLNVGVTSGWCSILQDMISPIGMSQKLIGIIGASLAFAQIIGALLGLPIIDKYFHGKLKKCILLLQFMDILWFFIAFLLLPNCLLNNDTFITISSYNMRFVIIYIICVLIGLNFGLLTPLYFELMAEITFPVAETSSTNAVMIIAVPIMMGIMQIGSLNTSLDTPLGLLLVIIAFILDLFVVEKYQRPKDTIS